MTATDQKPNRKSNPLGKVTALGPKSPDQAPLLLPKDWDDMTNPIHDFSGGFAEGQLVLLSGYLYGSVRVTFKPAPRISGTIADTNGNLVRFSCFGDTRALQDQITLNAKDLVLFGQISFFDGSVFINNVEVPERRWLGRMRPVYPSKPKVITSDTVRARLGPLMREAIPKASAFIKSELGMSEGDLLKFDGTGTFANLSEILISAHYPKTRQLGEDAQRALMLIAAFRAVAQARAQGSSRNEPPKKLRVLDSWEKWAQHLPFALSQKQVTAVSEIVSDFSENRVMRRLLTGDVGYGKTAVFGLAAAAMYGSGGRVCILLPSETLAEQCFRELAGYWPAAAPDMKLITGSVAEGDDLSQFKWLIGTTALLFRHPGEFHLVIVDEQQKFSREQRAALLSPGTHLLEATATCIPRSQALIQFGGFDSTVLDVPPIPRDIKTKVRYGFDRQDLFNDAKKTLARGEQILVVYPKRSSQDEAEENKASGINDVEAGAAAWERIAPGQVRIAHSARGEEANTVALDDMRNGRASVLVATTVVEVGVNIPNLRRVIIVHPHRFGLSTLHQIRGRAARTGGVGFCDLYLPDTPKEKSLDRLHILERTQNGFEIALEDLRIRGCGNLSADSSMQSGADDTIIFGRPLTPDMLEEVIALENSWA